MPPKGEIKTKAQKAAAAQAGGKGKKKKWSKGKQKEKVNGLVLFDQTTYDKMLSEVPKYKLITTSVMAERLRINGSLARKGLTHLLEKGMIKKICSHSKQHIYTRATG